MKNSVTSWFGTQFEQLHPLLQQLHLHGGRLSGEVAISFGKGIAGIIGRRIARKLGIPDNCLSCHLEVFIHHTDECLIWDRRFGDAQQMISIFKPVGDWQNGYWIETTGFLTLHLAIDIIDGGWYWRVLGAYIGKLKLPLILLPTSEAYKRIEHGKYNFLVKFALPYLGTLLSYKGLLDAS